MSAIPLALLPGTLNDEELWADQVSALSDIADCHVFDLLPHGDLRSMAQAVLSVMPDRFAVAGLSMGGYVALDICRIAPERVTGIGLFDTTARPDEGSAVKRRSHFLDLADSGDFKTIVDDMMPLFLHRSRLDGSDLTLRDRVRKMALRTGLEPFRRHYLANRARLDSRPLLPTISVPALVMCGIDDVLTPDEHAEMANLLPNARLAVLDGCAHLTPMEAPDAVSAELRAWLHDISLTVSKEYGYGVS